jgi:uncharacterized SAM-binding protein YcdF (DUF218 family)
VYIIKFIYGWVLPPGGIILGLLFLSIWVYQKSRRPAKILLFFTLLFYLLAAPYFSSMLMRSLESRYSPPANVSGDVVIVLGGGATVDTPNMDGLGNVTGSAANRILTGALLERKLNVPLIIAGGQVYSDSGNEAQITRQIWQGLGVKKIFMEDQSLNTRQNAENVQKILESNGFKNPILVTSAFHMMRSVFYFEKIGVEVVPYPADYRVNVANEFSLHNFVPSSWGFDNSCLVLKEYLGLAGAKWVNY